MKTEIEATGLVSELSKLGLELEIVDPNGEKFDPYNPVINCIGEDGVTRPRNVRLKRSALKY